MIVSGRAKNPFQIKRATKIPIKTYLRKLSLKLKFLNFIENNLMLETRSPENIKVRKKSIQ
jgi:hypothetical protein